MFQHHEILQKKSSQNYNEVISPHSEWPLSKSANNKCWRGYGLETLLPGAGQVSVTTRLGDRELEVSKQ